MEKYQLQVSSDNRLIISHSFSLIQEYHQFVTIGQTHSVATHNKYYALKKRKIEEAKQNEQLFDAHFIEHPLPSPSILDEYSEIIQSTSTLHSTESPRTDDRDDDPQRKEFDQLLKSSNYTFSNLPTPETLSALNDLEFGIARNDIEKKAKRFEWINEELDYLDN